MAGYKATLGTSQAGGGQPIPRWPGLLIFLALLIHAWDKAQRGILPEMLWFCHVASACIGVGILLRIPWLNAIGFLFHASIGLLGYLLDVFATGTTRLMSVVVHLLPLVLGGVAVRCMGYAEGTLWRTLVLFFLVVQPLSYFLTPPLLNVNLVFSPWPALAPWFPNIWLYRLFNALLGLAFLSVGDLLLKRWLGKKQARNDGQ